MYMQNSDNILTIIIGERSNLSYHLLKRLNHTEVFSSNLLLKSLSPLNKFRAKKINIIFNNFQPSIKLNSYVDPCKYLDLSISLTINVLMHLIKAGALINQIIYTSSCSVYGNLERKLNYSDTSPIGIPSSLKYLNEQILKELCGDHGFKLTIARIFNIFGGNDDFSVINKIYNCYVNKTMLNILNEGKSVRDYIHVENIVDVYEKILLESTITFEIIDVGSGEGRSVADILNYLSIKGYNIDTKSSVRSEIQSSKANIKKIEELVDISSFIDVNSFLIDKLNSSKFNLSH